MNRILEDKAILIAGAGGIGSVLAQRYAEEGARVVLGDIDLAAAESVVHEIVQVGGEAIAIHLDGADEASVERAIAVCRDAHGGLDGLHANFAYMVDNNPTKMAILELPLEVFDETQRVNARGFYLCTRAALRPILERGGGSIVYTSSAAAHATGGPVAYSMSKAAGHALMRHVASHYGPMGVRANTIAPAMTIHPRVEELVPARFLEIARDAAAIKSRVGRPEDIAAMGALLLSDDGSYITGQVISIDGGTTMRT